MQLRGLRYGNSMGISITTCDNPLEISLSFGIKIGENDSYSGTLLTSDDWWGSTLRSKRSYYIDVGPSDHFESLGAQITLN